MLREIRNPRVWGVPIALVLLATCSHRSGSRLPIQLSPLEPQVATGGRLSFRAARLGVQDPGLVWRLLDPASGLVLPGGTYLAPDRPGTYRLQVLDPGSGELAETRVHVGLDTGDPATAATAELFDPTGMRGERVGRMHFGRIGHAACLLRDGRVLVAGGRERPGGPELGLAELFDPASRTFRLSLALGEPRSGGTLTPLLDGRVLLLGGGRSPDLVEFYDPAKDLYVRAGSALAASLPHQTLLLRDGRVLVVGAGLNLVDPGGTVQTLEVALPAGITGRTLTQLGDGSVLLAGGLGPGGLPVADLLLLDLVEGRLTAKGTLATPRGGHAAHLMPGGKLLFYGGVVQVAAGEADGVEELDLETWATRPGARLEQPFPDAPLVGLADGRLVALGSRDPLTGSGDVTLLVPLGGRVRPLRGLQVPRTGHATTLLPDGQILVTGGAEDPASLKVRRKLGARS